MRLIKGIGAVALMQFGLLACTPSTNVPGTELYVEAADGKYHGPMESIRLTSSEITFELSTSETVRAFGVFEDGVEVEVTGIAAWSIENEAVVSAPSKVDGAVSFTAMYVGTTALSTSLGNFSAKVDLTIVPASLTEMAINGPATVGRGVTSDFSVEGTFRDGSKKIVTDMITWTSSDESVLAIVNGRVKGVEVGQATLTVTHGDISADLPITVECRYPEIAPTFISNFEVMPNLSWTAFDENGVESNLDLEAVHCAADWQDTKTMAIMVSAEWCLPCQPQMRWLAAQADAVTPLGMQIVYNEIQDTQGRNVMTSQKAATFIDTIIPGGKGLRIGDADAMPTRNIMNTSPNFIEAFPTIFVVRTRDMKIIASVIGGRAFDLAGIAANPEWDWSDVDNPVEGFVSVCEDGVDESYEPNDVPSEAADVGAVAFTGGICTDAPDYYRVNLTGRYAVTVVFEHDVGDLDVYVWNEQANAPMQRNRNPVGSFSTNNNESFEWEGPALIRVQGKRNDSAPYAFYIEEL